MTATTGHDSLFAAPTSWLGKDGVKHGITTSFRDGVWTSACLCGWTNQVKK